MDLRTANKKENRQKSFLNRAPKVHDGLFRGHDNSNVASLPSQYGCISLVMQRRWIPTRQADVLSSIRLDLRAVINVRGIRTAQPQRNAATMDTTTCVRTLRLKSTHLQPLKETARLEKISPKKGWIGEKELLRYWPHRPSHSLPCCPNGVASGGMSVRRWGHFDCGTVLVDV